MILLGLLGTTPTSACSLSAPTGLTIDTSIEDELAPAPPVLIDVVVSRGRGGQADSCADIGTIWITLERPDGDPDSDDEVGYRLLQLDGTLPQGFVLLPYPILGPELYLHWIDEATDEQEAFGFTLELTPVTPR